MSRLFQPEQLELSNGIPVLLQQFEGAVAATYWWVRTGSADEEPKQSGFAHFLEHMLFKDAAAKESGRASSGMMARAIESLGGDINAYTSFDQTVYHVTCAAHHWEKVIDAFGAMARPQRFLKLDFDREREVILEELKRNQDSPSRQMFETLFSLTFRKHPYGKPVIGFEKNLRSARIGELEGFYKSNYASSKMGLVLVGPVEDGKGGRRERILKSLERRFGSGTIPRRASPKVVRAVEPELRTGAEIKTKAFDVKTPSLIFSFRVPELKAPDSPALDVLAGILGMGELSRLYQRLFYQTSLAVGVSGGLYVPSDPGMLYFQAELQSLDKAQAVAEEMFREMKCLADEGPTAEELARVIVNAESERLYATQTADSVAGRLGFMKFGLDDMSFDETYLAELKRVDGERLKAVARAYLEPRRMSGVVLVPKSDSAYDAAPIRELAERLLPGAEGRAPELASASSGAVLGGAKRKKPRSILPMEQRQLASGLKVVLFERPQSQVFSVHASMHGGLRMELSRPIEDAEHDWGSSQVMAMTWTKGASGKDSRAIAKIVEGHAAGLDGFAGRSSVGLQMTGLARDWSELTRLFTEVLTDPAFVDEEVDHTRRVLDDTLKGIDDHSDQLCSRLFLETLFEHHPYGRLIYGSLGSLAGIRGRKLKAFHSAWLRPANLVISVSGSVNRAALDPWVEDLDWRLLAAGAGISGTPPESLHLKDEPVLKAPRWVERNLGREQTHIMVGGLGTTISAEDRHALKLMQTILGGQSGRLFIELREKRSLAYTVAPVSFEGVERGYVGTYIACAPAKREEAISGIRRVHEQLARKGPTRAEMERAQEYHLGRRAMDLQSDSAIASSFGLETLYGISYRTEEELAKKIRAITPRQIQDACRRYLVEPHHVTGVVG